MCPYLKLRINSSLISCYQPPENGQAQRKTASNIIEFMPTKNNRGTVCRTHLGRRVPAFAGSPRFLTILPKDAKGSFSFAANFRSSPFFMAATAIHDRSTTARLCSNLRSPPDSYSFSLIFSLGTSIQRRHPRLNYKDLAELSPLFFMSGLKYTIFGNINIYRSSYTSDWNLISTYWLFFEHLRHKTLNLPTVDSQNCGIRNSSLLPPSIYYP